MKAHPAGWAIFKNADQFLFRSLLRFLGASLDRFLRPAAGHVEPPFKINCAEIVNAPFSSIQSSRKRHRNGVVPGRFGRPASLPLGCLKKLPQWPNLGQARKYCSERIDLPQSLGA